MSPEAVTRVINKYGGHGLMNDYSRLKQCPVGKAVIGCGFDLPCDYVIHTASPVCVAGFALLTRSVSYTRIHATEEDAAKLKECYSESMSLCAKKGIKSVAFPCLGTRSHRYPLEEASKVEAEELVRSLGENATVERVILCTQSDAEMNIVKSALESALKSAEGEKQSLLCSTNTPNQSRFHVLRLFHTHNLQTGSRDILQ